MQYNVINTIKLTNHRLCWRTGGTSGRRQVQFSGIWFVTE